MLMRPRLAACLIAGALGTAAAVHAQSFVGVGPVRSFVLPTEPREPTIPASLAVPAPAAPPAIAAPVADALRRLPLTQRGFRFEGERGESEWPVYLTAVQAREPARFRLVALSAISVMPEGSQLGISVNDNPIGRVRLGLPDADAGRDFTIPAGLLKPGFNAIRITVEQRHRVDCSPAATYELWTALDPARTGLALGGGAERRGFETSVDLAGIPPRADGALPIRLVLSGKLTPEMAARVTKAVQIAALASRALRPVVGFAAAGQPADGLDLAIGTVDELRATLDMAEFGVVAGPRYGFLPERAGRAATFVVTGTSAADLDIALARWDAERLAGRETGTPAGLRALKTAQGHAASGGPERIALRETGFASTEFSGRLIRLGLDVAMPLDFLPADYDRMALNLAGSHGAGLSEEARILVEVNGRNAATQTLGRGGARDLDGNQIFLPLGLMRPGQNRIEILAQVPVEADRGCASRRSGEARRLQILDRSELVLPRLARIGRAPELSLMAAGGFPFARDGARPILFVPQPDRSTMAAALTLAARLAVSAARPIEFSFAMTPPASDAGEVLMVSPAPALAPAQMRASGLDPERVQRAWQGRSARADLKPASDDEAMARRCDLPRLPAPAPVPASDQTTGGSGFSLAALGLRASLPALPFQHVGEAPGVVAEEAVSERAALLVGQDFPADRAANLWTVVTAPDAATLQAGVDCLTHPQIWSRLAGRISAVNADETLAFVPTGERVRYVATQAFGLVNTRLVAAGWLSLNPLSYVAIALLLVLCLAASTLWLVLNTGRRQE